MASIHSDVGSANLVAAPLPANGSMTETEFLAWCDEDTRAEWVDGKVIVMSPVSTVHSRLTRFLISLLNDYAEERELGEALGPEISVRINSKRRRLPDVLFVAKDRADRLHENHFEGAPNLIIEVVSEDSVDRDWRVKYLEYEAVAVEEYWVIDPLYQRVEAYALGANRLYESIAPTEGKIASRVVPGFYLRPEWLWQQPLPKIRTVLSELLRPFQGE
jgi:Uma2 family endonuclease